MVKQNSSPFYSEALPQIEDGEVVLSAPLRGDAFQVASFGYQHDALTSRSEISVVKDTEGVSVSRTDGEPFQAEIVEIVPSGQGGDPLSHVRRSPVFVEAVPDLQFCPAVDAEDQDVFEATGENLVVTEQRHLERLANTIGSFAVAKQAWPGNFQ